MTDKKNKPTPCNCNCSNEKVIDTSRREFIRKASAITLVGGTAFILEACGGAVSYTHLTLPTNYSV